MHKYTCDRCGVDITALVHEFESRTASYGATGGYYKDWFGPGRVCDECMWRDPRYIKLYGTMSRDSFHTYG